MLSALLTQIQTQLLSKRFLLGSVLPLFLFLFGNGWMLWLYYPPFPSWISKIDSLKEQSILFTVLTTLVLVLAYAFSALNSTLLEWLEGKRGPISWIGNLLYGYQQAKLEHIEERYAAITINFTLIKNALDSGLRNWIDQLAQARSAGDLTNQCDPNWEERPEAKTIRQVLRRRRFGCNIPYEDLSAAVTGLRTLLSTNSANLEEDVSKKLRQAHIALKEAIYFARDRSQFERVQLYNERQFSYPGDMNPGHEPSPHNVLSPTTMGNIGSTMRSYAITRYNLDLDIFWSRFQNSVQSDKDYFGVLQDVKVQVDCLVALIWLIGLFALIWTPIAFCKGSTQGFLLVGCTGFVPLVLYSLACNTYRVFADLMRGAVDLFRFRLLGNLHIPLPSGSEQEMLLWERLGNTTGYARRERFPYKHP